MKHIVPYVVKFVGWSIVMLSIFAIFNAPPLLVWFMAAGTALASYIVGDLLILPRFGNFVAVIADLLLSFLLIWLTSYALIEPTMNMAYASFFCTLAIGAIEAFFHLFMENHILEEARKEEAYRWYDDGRWATEFAEEYEQEKDDRT
ncbi:YndM family protein [Saccharococcus thermophilus]|uniref:YndM family protein n=1 Tax=Saccharococcus thermophilus TaxID=29396 RepID=UPI00362A3EFA